MYIAHETCRLVPEKLSPDSFELVKSSKHGQNVYTKIYTKASGKAKCKVSELVDKKKSFNSIRRINQRKF